jgi:RNA recognition motif-containing protein
MSLTALPNMEVQFPSHENSPTEESGINGTGKSDGKKRKRNDDTVEEIEVDVNAPEPLSKKAARKAKRLKKERGNSRPSSESKPANYVDFSEESSGNEDEDDDEDRHKPSKPEKERSEFGVWIGNLAFTTTKEEIRQWIISQSGLIDSDITRLHMPTPDKKDKKPGARKPPANRGYAYLDTATEEGMNKIIGLSESLLFGRALLIKASKNFDGRPEKKEGEAMGSNDHGKPPNNKIFVGNLAFETTEDDLRQMFGVCGELSKIHMASFEDTGKCKGFAWIEFEDIEAAKMAVRGWVKADANNDDNADAQHKGRHKKIYVNRLHGRNLRMEYAEDKATRYKKRYGKEKPSESPRATLDSMATIEGVSTLKPHTTKPLADYRGGNSVVQKMTGGIVQSQGKKTSFG